MSNYKSLVGFCQVLGVGDLRGVSVDKVLSLCYNVLDHKHQRGLIDHQHKHQRH